MTTTPFNVTHDNGGRPYVVDLDYPVAHILRNGEERNYYPLFSVNYKQAFVGWDPNPNFDVNEVWCLGNSVILELPENVNHEKLCQLSSEDQIKREFAFLDRVKISKRQDEKTRRRIPKIRRKRQKEKMEAKTAKTKIETKIRTQHSNWSKETQNFSYMLIGTNIEIFNTATPIQDFIAHVGNNDVVYEYAVTSDTYFLMSGHVRISRETLDKFSPDDPNSEISIEDLDPYMVYYGHWTSKKNPKRKEWIQKFTSYPYVEIVSREW